MRLKHAQKYMPSMAKQAGDRVDEAQLRLKLFVMKAKGMPKPRG